MALRLYIRRHVRSCDDKNKDYKAVWHYKDYKDDDLFEDAYIRNLSWSLYHFRLKDTLNQIHDSYLRAD